jgi:GNAT superfamily N-acetyltransferase
MTNQPHIPDVSLTGEMHSNTEFQIGYPNFNDPKIQEKLLDLYEVGLQEQIPPRQQVPREDLLNEMKHTKIICANDASNNPVGILMYTVSKEEDRVDLFFITSSVKGKGIGKKMLKHLAKRLKEEEWNKRIYTTVSQDDPTAIIFYDKTGFKPTGVIVKKEPFVINEYSASADDVLNS